MQGQVRSWGGMFVNYEELAGVDGCKIFMTSGGSDHPAGSFYHYSSKDTGNKPKPLGLG
jgi:hypothetical protein